MISITTATLDIDIDIYKARTDIPMITLIIIQILDRHQQAIKYADNYAQYDGLNTLVFVEKVVSVDQFLQCKIKVLKCDCDLRRICAVIGIGVVGYMFYLH